MRLSLNSRATCGVSSVEQLSDTTTSKSSKVCASRDRTASGKRLLRLYVGMTMLKNGDVIGSSCQGARTAFREKNPSAYPSGDADSIPRRRNSDMNVFSVNQCRFRCV